MKDIPVTVPEATADTSYFAVEFPGYLEDLSNPEKALETFGGLEGCRNSVKVTPEYQCQTSYAGGGDERHVAVHSASVSGGDSVEYAVDAYGSGRDAVRSRMYSTMRSGVVLLEYGAPSAPKDAAGYFHDDVDDSDPRLSTAGHVLRKIFKKGPVYELCFSARAVGGISRPGVYR
eukprot:jgi/Picre1/34133/NNA_001608.t1